MITKLKIHPQFLFGLLVVIAVSAFIGFATPSVVEAQCIPPNGFGCRTNPIGGPGCYPPGTYGPCGGGCSPSDPPNTCSGPCGTVCWDQGCGLGVACNPCRQSECCAFTPPTPPVSLSPANNATIHSSSVTFLWDNPFGWGSSCPGPTTYTNYVYVRANCAGGWVRAATLTVPFDGPQTITIPGFSWNTTYCWIVSRSNNFGFYESFSQSRQFTIVAPPTVTISNPAFSGLTCTGSTISGLATTPNTTNNPVRFQVDVNDPFNNFSGGVNRLQELRVAVVPITQQNALNVPFPLMDPILYNRMGFRAVRTTGTNYNFQVANTAASPYYGSAAGSGNISNTAGTASLLGLNTVTGTRVQQLDNQRLRITWNMRFDNSYPTTNLNVYVAAVSQTSPGVFVSQNGSSTDPLVYTRVSTWETDMQPPVAQVGTPVVTGPDTFTLNWQASDTTTGNNGLLSVNSYCYVVNGDPVTLRTPATSPNQSLNLPGSAVTYPSASNCLVGAGNLGTHSYLKVTNPIIGDMSFNLHARDGACNVSQGSSAVLNPVPWMLTNGGIASAGGGFKDILVRNVDDFTGIVPGLGDDSFLGSFSVIAGDTDLPSTRQSKRQTYTTNYADYNIYPPPIIGNISWYQVIQDLVSARQTITNSSDTTVSGNVNDDLGLSANATGYVQMTTPNITVSAGSVCNVKAIIFVSGNLTLAPNFTKTSGNGCIFVVLGNITIGVGNRATPASTPTTSPAEYDEVHAMFITDAAFNTTLDQFAAGQVPDALYILGGVIAKTVDLNRDLTQTHNSAQPAEVFDYDPLYTQLFRSVLSIRKFSLREE